MSLGLFYSYVPDVLDAHLVTNGVAVLSSVGLAGAFLAPIVAGVLVDVGGYALPFAYVVGLAVVGAALAFVAGEPGR